MKYILLSFMVLVLPVHAMQHAPATTADDEQPSLVVTPEMEAVWRFEKDTYLPSVAGIGIDLFSVDAQTLADKLICLPEHTKSMLFKIAATNNWITIVQILYPCISMQEKETVLFWATGHGAIAVVRWFLQQGTDPDIKSLDKEGLLHVVARGGYISVPFERKDDHIKKTKYCSKRQLVALMKLVLEHGADVNIRDKDGNTPLHIALREKYPFLVDILLDHEKLAENAVNNDGKKPMEMIEKPITSIQF